MISYQFIYDLFSGVLRKSKAIGGRFYVSDNSGREINTDVLGQVLSDVLLQTPPEKKYPLVIMLPPRSRGKINHKDGGFMDYFITTFWLKLTYYGDGVDINPNTGTALHTVLQDWHDMRRCAEAFMRVLDRLQRAPGAANIFRISGDEKQITPISKVGTDRVSGVQLDFMLSMFSGCNLEDYDLADITTSLIPPPDGHPEHAL